MRLHPRTLMIFITPAVLIGLWWGYVTLFKIPPFILPPPQVVGNELVRLFASGTI
jgi:NitT/TauT family transport system permease protein